MRKVLTIAVIAALFAFVAVCGFHLFEHAIAVGCIPDDVPEIYTEPGTMQPGNGAHDHGSHTTPTETTDGKPAAEDQHHEPAPKPEHDHGAHEHDEPRKLPKTGGSIF